jgi:hypothetical protein
MNIKISLIFLAFILVASCKRNSEQLPDIYEYEYLTAEQLAKTPYFNNPDFDTLTYISNKQDTLVFAKTTIDSSWYQGVYTNLGNDVTTYTNFQQIKINYQTLKGNGDFGVKYCNWDDILFGPNILRFNINGFEFYCGYYHIGEKLYHTFKESLDINGKTYKDLIVLYSTSRDTTSNEAYINQSYGLFQLFNKEKNTSYTLQTP